jgi:hypothetical protein
VRGAEGGGGMGRRGRCSTEEVGCQGGLLPLPSHADGLGGRSPMKPKNGMRPIHPGEILHEEFLEPLDMSARMLAGFIHVPPTV